MTSRSKNAVRSYETEIEKSREESNWKKVIELAQQLKARSTQHESLAHFLIGEGKLEAYLEECPPLKENIERAQRELSDARGYLTLATDEAGNKAGVALDAHLLFGKLNYACGEYDEALKHYKLAELNTLTEKELPVRSLRIVAESYAIKGLCLEQIAVPGSSRYKQAEREGEMIRCFELASDLTLLYLQKTNSLSVRAGPTLEMALQRVPILHIRGARLQNAIDRYREMLSAVESASTQALRLTLTRQLAEVLLRGVTGQVYKAPEKPAGAIAQQGTLSRRRDDHVSVGPWKPKKYAGINQFVPTNEFEEVILLLLIGEAMAVRDAVLSQSPEFEAARLHSLENATAVYDLLALATLRWGQLCLIVESLERAMKFSFGQEHVWRQRALAAAAAATAPSATAAPLVHPSAATKPSGGSARTAGAGVRAQAVLVRATEVRPRDAPLRLLGANTCYQMGLVEEGLELAEAALDIEEKQPGFMLARCHLYVGIGYQMKSQKSNSRLEKQACNDKCLKGLVRAVQLDANDHLAFYQLALQYAREGLLNEAMDATRSCLRARASCAGGLRLLAVLWSCGGVGGAGGATPALHAARLARDHYPVAEWPLWALAALQIAAGDDADGALATGKELLRLVSVADGDPDAEPDALSESLHDDTHSNRDAASMRAESAGAFRVERALSDQDSSESSRRARPPHAAQRAHAWLLLADLCLRSRRVEAAAGCAAEAAALTPHSHLVFYTRGLVHGASGEWEEARQCFQNAIAIHPTHLDSIIQLGVAYYELGWLRLAERALREAAQLEPARADTWRRLAQVLGALGEHEAAADAAAAAIELHPTNPALPLL